MFLSSLISGYIYWWRYIAWIPAEWWFVLSKNSQRTDMIYSSEQTYSVCLYLPLSSSTHWLMIFCFVITGCRTLLFHVPPHASPNRGERNFTRRSFTNSDYFVFNVLPQRHRMGDSERRFKSSAEKGDDFVIFSIEIRQFSNLYCYSNLKVPLRWLLVSFYENDRVTS